MDTTKQRPSEVGFFDLPAELRLIIYSALRDSSRKGRLTSTAHPGKQGPSSYSNVLCPLGSKASLTRQKGLSPDTPVETCPVYEAFLSAQLTSKQFRKEYLPIWYHGWTFEIPRPLKSQDERFYAAQDDPDNLDQLTHFLRAVGEQGTSSLRHIRLAYRLGARDRPEASVDALPIDTLRALLQSATRHHLLHSKLVVHFEVQCSKLRPSNKRAVKDVLFRRDGLGWRCICDSGVTVSYGRSWD
ncbi:hypothetical protein MBLNU230_g8378t1 [Neophaeotheca triangularis]